MESRRDYWLSLALFLIMTATSLPVGASVNPSPPDRTERLTTAIVYTTSDSAVVEAARETKSSASASETGGGRRCRLERDTANVGLATARLYAEHAVAGETSFNLFCDGQFVGLVWRKTGPAQKPAVAPLDIAERLRQEIPIPAGTVRMNPDLGLVGTESWFWIEGYGGEPISATTDAFGMPVRVQAAPIAYEWSFGDGTTLVTRSPGKPFPARSEVRHVFQRASSLVPGGFYPVEVRFEFSVRFSLSGGPWVDLPGVARTAAGRYVVRDAKAVILR